MTHKEAIAFLKDAGIQAGETWADVGAGDGTFTHAIASLLGEHGAVYASDNDPSAVTKLTQLAQELSANEPSAARVQVTTHDLLEPLPWSALDGVIVANALHYVRYQDQARVLRQLASSLTANGRLVIIEYDREVGNQWVPYPVTQRALARIAKNETLSSPVVVASQPSQYGGQLYCAIVRLSVGLGHGHR